VKIGTVEIPGRLFLAPMAGVTDLAFRDICKENGAAVTVTEMVSTKALMFQDKKTKRLLELSEKENPASIQVFGSDPATMAAGAKKALEISGGHILDLNMGCPAPKIAGNGDGSALMKNPLLASRIITEVKKAVDVPVTVKFRKGWDESHINCLEFAKMAEESGADAICLHGRTRTQMYSGKADWDMIGEIKARAHIPVIANGDIFEPQDAVDILKKTGADFAMIGRGAMGNPWIFSRANALLAGKPLPPLPPFGQRLDTAVRQMKLAAQHKGEHIAMLEARKHVIWYLKGVSGMKEFKKRIAGLNRLEDLYQLRRDLAELE
jgi:tRNA-dihydrouridine synthase B